MATNPQIIIHGAGIAGLWTFHRLKKLGYDVLLLEKDSIGCGQTLASQGIIHSGLKYTLAGQVNALARQISQMPDLWRDALKGHGTVDLSAAKTKAKSQYMLIPAGFMGNIVKVLSKKALGGKVYEVPKNEWPDEIKNAGFKGTFVHMNEPVLDITCVIRGLAEPYKECIRKTPADIPKAQINIYTAAGDNEEIAKANAHDEGLKTQKRPLLMGFLKPAPFHLNAHLVGTSDKPVATITTHVCEDGALTWYLGGAVAERAKESDPKDVIKAVQKALKKYLPNIDQSAFQWATLPIDRVEGQSSIKGFMPDTPTVHTVGNKMYCWPTKLTFAPLLSDRILEHIETIDIEPSHTQSSFEHLQTVDYAKAPWDKVIWVKQ